MVDGENEKNEGKTDKNKQKEKKNERKEKANLKETKGMKLIDNKKPIEIKRVWQIQRK